MYVPAPSLLRPPRCLTASPAGLPEASSVPSPVERARNDTLTLEHTPPDHKECVFSSCVCACVCGGGGHPPVLYFGFLPPVC